MKNIIKSIAVFLFSVSIFSSAYAGTLTVTGTAKATYNIVSGFTNEEKGLGVENGLDFTATGKTGLGTFTYQVQQEATATTGAMSLVDQQLTLATPNGTVGVFISEGNLSLQDSGSRSVYGRPTDIGAATSVVNNIGINSYNNAQYHTPAGLLPLGIQAKIAYAPDASTTAVIGADANAKGTVRTVTGANAGNASAYQITAAPIKGLAIGADYLEHGEAGNAANKAHQKGEAGSAYFKYDIGAFGIGASKALYSPGQADAVQTLEYYDQLNYSVSYLANPNLSFSYEQEISKRHGSSSLDGTSVRTRNADVKNKSNAVQAAYTVGGITLALSYANHDNVSYTTGKDSKQTLFAATMAF